jgi:hypothetical protein
MGNVARKWFPVALIVAVAAGSGVAYGRLPAETTLPVEWLLPVSVDNQDVAPRWFASFLLPVVALVVWLGFQLGRARVGLRFARLLFPKAPEAATSAESIEQFRATYDIIALSVVTLILGVHAGLLAAALGSPQAAARIVTVVLGGSMILMGNVMPRLRPNLVAGLRTQQTLNDPQLWRSSHRAFGFALVISGIVTVLVGLSAPTYGFVTGIVLTLVSTIIPWMTTLRFTASRSRP